MRRYTRTFKAYKVFSANWEDEKVTNIDAGDGIDWTTAKDGKTVIQALNAADSAFASITDAKGLANALKYDADATEADKSAKKVLAEKAAKVLQEYVVAAKAQSITNGGKLGNGYWIIIDETTLAENDVANAALLQVSGDTVTIAVKTSKTTVDKEIDATTDADTTNDSDADGVVKSNNGQVGDLVPYIITATVADTTYYDKYYFKMEDTVSSGLDISAKDATGDAAFSAYAVDIKASGATEFATLNASKYTLTVNPTTRKIELLIQDAKEFGGAQIRLTYKAKINDAAVVGTTGNPNEVTLTYTNSPDHSGDGEYDNDQWTSTTPKSVVVTYVTGIKLLKIDTENAEKHLAGAVFEITGSRNLSTVVTTKGFTADAAGTYYKLKDNSYTETAPGGAIPNSDYDSTETKYKATENTEVKTETSTVKVQGTTDASGYLKFDELGAGEYTITEITAPTGYNLLTDPIKFTIGFTAPASVSEGTETCTWSVDPSTVQGIDAVTFDSTEGAFSITVKNGGGTTLPSTGGMGTTIFYIIGVVLLAGAAIILVTKRRMSAE